MAESKRKPVVQVQMTTAQKVSVETPYACAFTVHRGTCTVEVQDAFRAFIVAGATAGKTEVLCTSTDPALAVEPGIVEVTVIPPPAQITVGTPEPKSV